MSDNLVKKHLEELKLFSPEQLLYSISIDEDDWEIYKVADDILFYVRYELTGNLGYAFCAQITCKKNTYNCDTFYHVKSHGNEIKEEWDCGQRIRDKLMSITVSILKPY